MRTGGDIFGRQRVLSPCGVLPQQADRLDISLPIFENELLIGVDTLNIDSASFHQIKSVCAGDSTAMEHHISALVAERGKHHNRVTGSGGMLMGSVLEIGPAFRERNRAGAALRIGDRIATLVSLSLTPLKIERIRKVHLERDMLEVDGHAILFESGIFAVLPQDIPERLALAVLDVCGAPAQTQAMCRPGMTVVVIGGGGKSGLLCLYAAKQAVGPSGRVIGLDFAQHSVQRLRSLPFVDDAQQCDASDAVATFELVREITSGAMADLVVNVANVRDTEMASVLSARHSGTVYFFNMATSFTQATLGAEGCGSHVMLLMGNGYRPGHADMALQILRDSPEIRDLFEDLYGRA